MRVAGVHVHAQVVFGNRVAGVGRNSIRPPRPGAAKKEVWLQVRLLANGIVADVGQVPEDQLVGEVVNDVVINHLATERRDVARVDARLGAGGGAAGEPADEGAVPPHENPDAPLAAAARGVGGPAFRGPEIGPRRGGLRNLRERAARERLRPRVGPELAQGTPCVESTQFLVHGLILRRIAAAVDETVLHRRHAAVQGDPLLENAVRIVVLKCPLLGPGLHVERGAVVGPADRPGAVVIAIPPLNRIPRPRVPVGILRGASRQKLRRPGVIRLLAITATVVCVDHAVICLARRVKRDDPAALVEVDGDPDCAIVERSGRCRSLRGRAGENKPEKRNDKR